MAAPHPGDFLQVMNRRSELLRALGSDGTSKRALEEDLDVSRSTIDRGVRELEAKDLVERTGDGYRRTLTGSLALQNYDRFTRRTEGLCAGSALLTELPTDVEFDPAFLAGARVVETEPASPHRPLEELYSVVEEAVAVRGFAPAIHPQQVETYERQIVDGGMGVDIVLTEDAYDRLVADYPEALGRVVDQEHVSFHRTDVTFHYSLTVADLGDRTVAAVMIYGGNGMQGCLMNDSAPAVDWATDRYERAVDRADPVRTV